MRTITKTLLRGALPIALLAALWAACGDDASVNGEPYYNNYTNNNNGTPGADQGATTPDMSAPDMFVPETEEFLVQELATTSRYVFAPNGAAGSDTVARVDGESFGVLPIRVGAGPSVVRAAEVEGTGAVAYVLCASSSVVAIIRADLPDPGPGGQNLVHLMPVPREINALTLSPDGRHLIGYMDPNKPLPPGTSVASLQTMALIRLGASAEEDAVIRLSVTRQIRSIAWSADGQQAFVLGREGVNRLHMPSITAEALIPPLPLSLSAEAFPPTDTELLIAPAGDALILRSSQSSSLALASLAAPGAAGPQVLALRSVALPGIPTDIDLIPRAGTTQLLATIRDARKVAIVDLAQTFAAPEDAVPEPLVLDAEDVRPGLAQVVPGRDEVLLYSTLDALPTLGVLTLGDQPSIERWPLRNQIRAIAVSPDGASAIILHKPQPAQATSGTPQDTFQRGEGVTLLDIESGYGRPVPLIARPEEVVMVSRPGQPSLVFAMVVDPGNRVGKSGVMRLDLSTYRADFIALPRPPRKIGYVAGKVFISQDAEQGRITFLDVDSSAQRTVSGYELNARID
jgi:hypothetical protein